MNTTFDFKKQKLTVDDIPELNRDDTLYLVDFRATGESLSLNIESMFIYENLSQWLCSMSSGVYRGQYVVNSNKILRNDISSDNLVLAKPHSKSSTSVAERLPTELPLVKKIWTAVPHPQIDSLAELKGLSTSYCYDDFLQYNKKLDQKQALHGLTPSYFEINTNEDIQRALGSVSGFIKASIGSGGFSVYDIEKDKHKILESSENITGETKWYFEERADGNPHSVQIHKSGSTYTLFGYAKQYIDGTNYTGAELIDIDHLSREQLKAIQQACRQIDGLIDGYTGFLGFDFMASNNTIEILECNVRVTSTTIPTLLANATGTHEKAEYFEEMPLSMTTTDDVVLAESTNLEQCVLRFTEAQQGRVGASAFIQLYQCLQLPAKLSQENILAIKQSIEKNISKTISTELKNFWPYGWTLSFVLAESHCVLSSWHLQKNVFIDLFCCSEMDLDSFVRDMCKIFGGESLESSTEDRHTS